MRIASRFQRSGRSNDRRRRALAAGVWVGLISFGCFFELEPVVDLDGGVGGGGTAGAFAGEAGESPLGGNGGDGVGGTMAPQDGCELAGQKRCGGECVIASPSNGCGNPDCTPCAELDNAVAPSCSGDSGSCKVESCQVGFADCDGDLLTYNGQSGGNGCEYSFGTIASSTDPLVVPRVQIDVADDSRDDWSGIPAYRLEQTCVDCRDDGTAVQPSAQNEAPPDSDLSAYFRVAWDGDFLYVLAEAFDDHVFSQGSTVDNGRCETNASGDYVPGPDCEDGFTLYFDGLQAGGNYDNEARRITIGTSNAFFAPSQGQPPDLTVGMRVLPSVGPRCYRMEAQFKWTMLVSNQGQPVDGKFPPAANQTYGFDMAVSDWDPSVSDPSVLERQSQLFWTQRAAQSQLHPSIDGVGSIILTEHSADGEATAPQ